MQYLRKTLALLAAVSLLFAAAGSAAEVVKTVAVLPFQINADRDLSYLREGILDMLSSRLAWEGKVEVIEKQVVKEALSGHPGPLNEASAREVGTSLGADYVLFGSLTMFGDSVSIDAKMIVLKGDRPPVTVYAQTRGMGEVIPRINDFAQDVNNKIFGRRPTVVAAAPPQPRFSQAHPEKLLAPGSTPGQAGQPRFSQAHPEKLLAPGSTPGQAEQPRSELNPYFQVPSTTAQAGGFWQSQTLKIAITSMAVADVNQDGILEILILSPKELHIYQQAPGRLHLLKAYKGGREDHFLWVSAADLNHNQIPEIYISKRRRAELMSSFVLEWNGADWVEIAADVRWHLRAKNLPDRGEVLLGQSASGLEPFSGGIFILKRDGKGYKPLDAEPLPRGANIYSFTVADLTQDGSNEIMFVDKNGRLQIQDGRGEQLWESTDRFAASFDFMKGVVRDTTLLESDSPREKTYLNAPIVIADLDKDERPEAIVNKNISGVFGRSFVNINFFGKSELYSLSWNGLTMGENWRTPAFQGMSTAYEVADVNGDGQRELLVVLVSSPGTTLWKGAKSKLVVYPIAVSAKEAQARP